jgi:hypothetical protein
MALVVVVMVLMMVVLVVVVDDGVDNDSDADTLPLPEPRTGRPTTNGISFGNRSFPDAGLVKHRDPMRRSKFDAAWHTCK